MIVALNIYNSRPDFAGNCYWAFEVTDSDGHCVRAKISGGHSSIRCAFPEVSYNNCELKIREFDRMVKGWPYAGCPHQEIRQFTMARLARLKG